MIVVKSITYRKMSKEKEVADDIRRRNNDWIERSRRNREERKERSDHPSRKSHEN